MKLQSYDEILDVYKIEIEGVEDTYSNGGGGPRKAIARFFDGGLEIVEATSAVDGYPASFEISESSKAGLWRFTRS